MTSLTTLRLAKSGLPIKIIILDSIKVPDVVLEVEYFSNGSVKKHRVNAK